MSATIAPNPTRYFEQVTSRDSLAEQLPVCLYL